MTSSPTGTINHRRTNVQITISGRHVELPEEIKEYARKKAEKLLKFYDRIQAIEILWDVEGDQFAIEMIVTAGARNTFISRDIGPDGPALVDQAVEKLERQITKHKDKEKSKNRPSVGKATPLADQPGDQG